METAALLFLLSSFLPTALSACAYNPCVPLTGPGTFIDTGINHSDTSDVHSLNSSLSLSSESVRDSVTCCCLSTGFKVCARADTGNDGVVVDFSESNPPLLRRKNGKGLSPLQRLGTERISFSPSNPTHTTVGDGYKAYMKFNKFLTMQNQRHYTVHTQIDPDWGHFQRTRKADGDRNLREVKMLRGDKNLSRGGDRNHTAETGDNQDIESGDKNDLALLDSNRRYGYSYDDCAINSLSTLLGDQTPEFPDKNCIRLCSVRESGLCSRWSLCFRCTEKLPEMWFGAKESGSMFDVGLVSPLTGTVPLSVDFAGCNGDVVSKFSMKARMQYNPSNNMYQGIVTEGTFVEDGKSWRTMGGAFFEWSPQGGDGNLTMRAKNCC